MGDGKYHAALSVYHGLHCVNALRIHMDKDYYLKHGGLHQDGGTGFPLNFGRTHMCKLNTMPAIWPSH
jgi:hypothetical protein